MQVFADKSFTTICFWIGSHSCPWSRQRNQGGGEEQILAVCSSGVHEVGVDAHTNLLNKKLQLYRVEKHRERETKESASMCAPGHFDSEGKWCTNVRACCFTFAIFKSEGADTGGGMDGVGTPNSSLFERHYTHTYIHIYIIHVCLYKPVLPSYCVSPQVALQFPDVKILKSTLKISIHGLSKKFPRTASLLGAASRANAYVQAAKRYWQELGLLNKTLVFPGQWHCFYL